MHLSARLPHASLPHLHVATRPFSTFPRRAATHYDTLAVPSTAHKNQIKHSFYQLSKQLHPDVNPDPKAKERYHAVTEAYAVLSDDRRRRAYDRTLSSPSASAPTTAGYHSQRSAHWTYDARRHRGATHAWERRRPPPGSHSHARHEPNAKHAGRHYDASAHHDSAAWAQTDARHYTYPTTGWQPSPRDKAVQISVLSRLAQVTGIVVAVGWAAAAFGFDVRPQR
ncbi:DnaJ domain-containing protein [Vararia minispora EC-137]|uniref:DnaJ domain-containing protein n=1 Tax=Vararia minispora EC-137 TaxID=1314806 RepID=A0ACB8QZE6_9AGAM|nr:DnaJ domain-containing protein [Vararia minispora EC-137]